MLQGKTVSSGLYASISFSDNGQAWAIDRSKDRIAYYLDPASKKWTAKKLPGVKGRVIATAKNGDAWMTANGRRVYHFSQKNNAWQLEEIQPGGTTKPPLIARFPNIDTDRNSNFVTSAMAGRVDSGGAGWNVREHRKGKWQNAPSGWLVDVAHDSQTQDIWATNAYGDLWRMDRTKGGWVRMTMTAKDGTSATHAATVIGSQNSIFVLVRGRKKIWSKKDGKFMAVPTNGGRYPTALARAPKGKGVVRIYPNGRIGFSF